MGGEKTKMLGGLVGAQVINENETHHICTTLTRTTFIQLTKNNCWYLFVILNFDHQSETRGFSKYFSGYGC